jgi:hypothetical protein
VKAPFITIVIEDGFGAEGWGDTSIGVIENATTRTGFKGDVVLLNFGSERGCLKPDEARAIGRALIAAADHIQQSGAPDLRLEVGKFYFGEDNSVWKIMSIDAPGADDLIPANGIMVKQGTRTDLTCDGLIVGFALDGRCLIEEDNEDYTGNTTIREYTDENEGVHLVREAKPAAVTVYS